MFDDLDDAMLLGAGYALYRHGQDRQTAALISALRQPAPPAYDEPLVLKDPDDDEPLEVQANMLDFTNVEIPEDWEDLIGQTALKREVLVRLNAAKNRGRRAPHMLFASGYPGVGKTTVARMVARFMGGRIVEMVPPFKVDAIVRVAMDMEDGDVLFIDEIHKLTDGVGRRGAEILLKILEDGIAFLPSGEVVELADITVIGATTNAGLLPQTVRQRFKVKPFFEPYTAPQLGRICIQYAYRGDSPYFDIPTDVAEAIAYACRGTPRIIEEMVDAAADLADDLGRDPTGEELLEFLQVEPDGMTRIHINYLTAMRRYFFREARDGGTEYVAGEAAMMQIMREDRQGIAHIEQFLVETGLLDRTPRGRRLTDLGVARAEEFIRLGKGVRDVA